MIQQSPADQKATPPRTDEHVGSRPMPTAPEAEQAVISCVLQSPRDALIEAQEVFGEVNPFYERRHAGFWRAIVSLVGKNFDAALIWGRYNDAEGKAEPADRDYLFELVELAPDPTMVVEYAQVVWRKHQQRELIRQARKMAIRAYDAELDEVNELIADAEQSVFNLPREQRSAEASVADLAADARSIVDHYAGGFGTISGLPTGFRYWDKLTAGLHNREVVVVAGRPGTGKTSLAMNVVERVAVSGGGAVGVFSLEMSARDLMLRAACASARVNFHRLRSGGLPREEVELVKLGIQAWETAPVWIDDTSSLTAFELRSRLRRMKSRHDIKLAVLDYIQLIQLPKEFRGDRVNGMAAVSAALLASAKELDIPIIVLSQLSRDSEKDKKRTPRMSDLRDSGAIEQDAHFIGILHPKLLDREEEEALSEAIARNPMGNHDLPLRMEICKNRNGPSGTGMNLTFQRWCMRFEDQQFPSPTLWKLLGEEGGDGDPAGAAEESDEDYNRRLARELDEREGDVG